MMIFMLILKIIGIVLCVIIGILAIILFVPVCYKVDADIDEMDYTVRARWLGWLIRFEFRWKEKAHAVLKILWFVIDYFSSARFSSSSVWPGASSFIRRRQSAGAAGGRV